MEIGFIEADEEAWVEDVVATYEQREEEWHARGGEREVPDQSLIQPES